MLTGRSEPTSQASTSGPDILPRPSWPTKLRPHEYTSPPDVSARAWLEPQLTLSMYLSSRPCHESSHLDIVESGARPLVITCGQLPKDIRPTGKEPIAVGSEDREVLARCHDPDCILGRPAIKQSYLISTGEKPRPPHLWLPNWPDSDQPQAEQKLSLDSS